MALDALKNYAVSQDFKEKPQEKPKEQAQKALTAHIERDQKAWEYSKKQADNIRLSEDLRIKIYKGVQQEEDIYTLLVDAIKCISLMTGETVFYEQNIKKLKERE